MMNSPLPPPPFSVDDYDDDDDDGLYGVHVTCRHFDYQTYENVALIRDHCLLIEFDLSASRDSLFLSPLRFYFGLNQGIQCEVVDCRC